MRLIVVVGVALLAGACMGGPPGHGPRRGPGQGFDGDGPPRPRAQLFISPSGQPFRAGPDAPYPSAAWFAATDRDHDGRLTRDEFRADADAWFKVLDANGDGRVDMPEATRWEEELVPEVSRITFGGRPGGRRGGRRAASGRNELDTRRQGAAAYSLVDEPHPVRGADADFDFQVTAREWRAAADRRFALLDRDGDGVIRLADLGRTPAQGRPRAHAGSRGGRRPR